MTKATGVLAHPRDVSGFGSRGAKAQPPQFRAAFRQAAMQENGSPEKGSPYDTQASQNVSKHIEK